MTATNLTTIKSKADAAAVVAWLRDVRQVSLRLDRTTVVSFWDGRDVMHIDGNDDGNSRSAGDCTVTDDEAADFLYRHRADANRAIRRVLAGE
jgi:hypothetical protein